MEDLFLVLRGSGGCWKLLFLGFGICYSHPYFYPGLGLTASDFSLYPSEALRPSLNPAMIYLDIFSYI